MEGGCDGVNLLVGLERVGEVPTGLWFRGDVLFAYLALWVFSHSRRTTSSPMGQWFLMARPKHRGMEEATAQVHQTAGAIWFLGYMIHITADIYTSFVQNYCTGI